MEAVRNKKSDDKIVKRSQSLMLAIDAPNVVVMSNWKNLLKSSESYDDAEVEERKSNGNKPDFGLYSESLDRSLNDLAF